MPSGSYWLRLRHTQAEGTGSGANSTRSWFQRWLGFFGHEDKWTDCCTFPLWEEQIRCEDRDETMRPHSRPG